MALAPSTHLADAHRVIVTRSEREAQAWAHALQALGVPSESLPLIEIAGLQDPSPLASAWQAVPQYLAVMFVSANAVRHFMAARPAGAPLQPCRAWSTGPGTRAALLAEGWPAELIDSPDETAPQFDSEALWALVAPRVIDASPTIGSADAKTAEQAQPVVLIVRGADAHGQLAGRDWLALQMESAGIQVLQTVAYVRRAPRLSAVQQSRARQAMSDGSRWLFSSSEAALHLLQACPDLNLDRAKALATHPRIALRLKQSGWSCVDLVPAGLKAQAQSIKSLA
ncbi:uroporphyrinogen-III synthase [Limnohabitans sp.]|jgi:uroporphyrinogen-III synthase|uniref:uroporphyrinogen-III synthase n=1 Tax=Limnohabitans sp. TaxID=1907725 RepID=UPI0039BD2F8E|nr:uroporphyrinogen-III synthase [Comamonadaceae bacterium]